LYTSFFVIASHQWDSRWIRLEPLKFAISHWTKHIAGFSRNSWTGGSWVYSRYSMKLMQNESLTNFVLVYIARISGTVVPSIDPKDS